MSLCLQYDVHFAITDKSHKHKWTTTHVLNKFIICWISGYEEGNIIDILLPDCIKLSSLQWIIDTEYKKIGQWSALVPQRGQQWTIVESTVILPR